LPVAASVIRDGKPGGGDRSGIGPLLGAVFHVPATIPAGEMQGLLVQRTV